MDLDFTRVIPFFPALLKGLVVTLELTVICMILGSLIGLGLAFARRSSSRLLSLPATAYVEIFRGTPVLLQLFWIFFCLPLIIGYEPTGFSSCVLALTLFTAAVTSETFRAALRSVGREQYDAAAALGLSPLARTFHVVLPQTLLRATPVLVSNLITLFKESALVSAVGLADLMFVGQNISNTLGRPIELFTTVALVYFVLAFPLTRVVTIVERRLLRRLAL